MDTVSTGCHPTQNTKLTSYSSLLGLETHYTTLSSIMAEDGESYSQMSQSVVLVKKKKRVETLQCHDSTDISTDYP